MSKSCDELETVRYEVGKNGKWYSDHPQSWDVRKRNGATVRELVTRQNAEEVIAAERARYHALEEIAAGLVERTDKAEADNKRLREARS